MIRPTRPQSESHSVRPAYRLSARRSTDPAQPVLAAVGLTKTYAMGDVQVAALRGIDLTLGTGELVVLLGASGSAVIDEPLGAAGYMDLHALGRLIGEP